MYLCTLLYILLYFYQFISSNEKVSCSMCFVGGGGVTCSFFVTDNKKKADAVRYNNGPIFTVK